ncbi:hypothetical protein HYFRA_00014088 [Hymenoscyphus fraxineus]|uniref:Uncharacterized protein n=1 Tax=Hymenoscyphus fraxineus TaxID=746836 RepID=A0A9N9L7N8_9HELO|nr:hypothetical protein HYFRA_00014088 [Hymenoscyphus fraxineus]
MPSTFTSLPHEILQMILREYLSIENNWAWKQYHKDTKKSDHTSGLAWHVPSEIFTVNKQLSTEALEAFHKENTLVHLSTNDCDFINRYVGKVIPLLVIGEREEEPYVVGREDPSLPSTALHIYLEHGEKEDGEVLDDEDEEEDYSLEAYGITQDMVDEYYFGVGTTGDDESTDEESTDEESTDEESTDEESTDEESTDEEEDVEEGGVKQVRTRKPQACTNDEDRHKHRHNVLFSARYLQRFVQLVNAVYSSSSENSAHGAPAICGITFDFKASGNQYAQDIGLAKKMAEGLYGLRYGCINEQYRQPKFYPLEIRMDGLDSDTEQRLQEASNLPPWNPNQSREEAQRLKLQGDLLQKQNRHIDARSTYIIAGLMMSAWGFDRLRGKNEHRHFGKSGGNASKGTTTLAGIWLGASRSLKVLGQGTNGTCLHKSQLIHPSRDPYKDTYLDKKEYLDKEGNLDEERYLRAKYCEEKCALEAKDSEETVERRLLKKVFKGTCKPSLDQVCHSCKKQLWWSYNRACAAKTIIRRIHVPTGFAQNPVRFFAEVAHPQYRKAEEAYMDYCRERIEHGEVNEAKEMLKFVLGSWKLAESMQLQEMLADIVSRFPDLRTRRRAKRAERKEVQNLEPKQTDVTMGAMPEDAFPVELFEV